MESDFDEVVPSSNHMGPLCLPWGSQVWARYLPLSGAVREIYLQVPVGKVSDKPTSFHDLGYLFGGGGRGLVGGIPGSSIVEGTRRTR